MKKIYSKPETEVYVGILGELMIIEPSPRQIGGGPTDKEYDTDTPLIPVPVKNTSTIADPFQKHGQGSGGAGTRSKGSLWDDDEEW